METLLSIFAGLAIVGLIKLLNSGKAQENADLSDLCNPDDERSAEIVKAVYMDLKRQGAGAFGQWLPSLMEGPLYVQYDERGRVQVKALTRPVTPGIALSAVRMTISELAGGRFNLDALLRAESELANMGGPDKRPPSPKP